MGPEEDAVFTPPPPGFERQDPKPIGDGRSPPPLSYGPYDISTLPPVPILLQSLEPIDVFNGAETLHEFFDKVHLILLYYSTKAKSKLVEGLKTDQEAALATYQKRRLDTQKEIEQKLNDIWIYIKALYHFYWVTNLYEGTNAKKEKVKDSYCKIKKGFIELAKGYNVELGEEPEFAEDGCIESDIY